MSESEKLQISYRYTYPMLKEAIRLASRRASRRGPSTGRLHQFLIPGSALPIVLILVVFQQALGLGSEVVGIGIVAYFAALCLFAVYSAVFIGAIASDLLKKPQYSGEISMSLGSDGVSVESECSTCWFGWSVVDEVVEMKAGLGLSSGCCIYPVPDQALPAGMAREMLRDKIESWREAAA